MRSVRSAAQSVDLRRGSGILLAVLGLLGLVIIIYFKLEVDLPVKIAIGLAAGGIAGALPGSLIFKSRAVSAGGAVGVFCVVMFYDAGQAWVEPISKSTHAVSSVTMSKKQMVIQNGLMSAQFELMRGDYGSAIDVIYQMLNLREDDLLWLSMIGYS